MKFTIYSTILALLLFFSGCTQTSTKKITNKEDYQKYLSNADTIKFYKEKENLRFWKNKLKAQPNQYPYLLKIAGANTTLFSTSGAIDYLKEAENNLLKVNKKSSTSENLRALARNYISQHKFQESLELLKKAEANGENLNATQKMLFDVYLELGKVEQAEKYLILIEESNSFDYFIRASKWNDNQGNLDAAISFLERALKIAESGKNKKLLVWSYTNLADFYGHNNEIKKSYEFYLRSLALDPNNAYAKKGIAWIVYSYEKNPEEALRILTLIQQTHQSPDYYLLKAEISEYMNNKTEKNKNIELFLSSVGNDMYGEMYNQHYAKLYLDEVDKKEQALDIIEREIINRPTPESYSLLAWASYKKGDIKEALAIANKYVEGKSHEPEILYHLAEIYKANNVSKKAQHLKEELMESSYELGPVMALKIKNI